MKSSEVEVEVFLLDFESDSARRASSVAVALETAIVLVPTDFSTFCFFLLTSIDGSK